MPHTKFQGNQPHGSREVFLSFLSYMGMAAILVMRPDRNTCIYTFFSPLPGGCILNLNEIGPVTSEKMSFENVDDGWWADNGRYHPISCPGANKGS